MANRPSLLKLVCKKCGWIRWLQRHRWLRGNGKRCRTCREHTMQVEEWGWKREGNIIVGAGVDCPLCLTGRRSITDTGLVSPCANCGDDEMTKVELDHIED